MTQARADKQPTVEEMLASIRQAINGEKSGVSSSLRGSPLIKRDKEAANSNRNSEKIRRELKLRQKPAQRKPVGKKPDIKPVKTSWQGLSKPRHKGFEGLLSGDMRLEDALSNLATAGLGDKREAIHNPAMGNTEMDFPLQPPIADDDSFRGSVLSNDFSTAFDDDEYIQDEFDSDYSYSPQEAPVSDEMQAHHDYEPEPVAEPLPAQPPSPEPVAVARPQPVEQVVPEPPQPSPVAPQAAAIPAQPAASGNAVSGPLTSQASSEAASNAFNRLADTIVSQSMGGERSIDDITRELLRPMLQTWLDENLPRVVERLVREEIERVARWGGKS